MTHILLVCADQTLSETIREVLQEKLIHQDVVPFVVESTNMDQAKSELSKNEFNLVISDLHIPSDQLSPIDTDERGLELLEWMRDSTKNCKTPAELIIPRLGYKDSERISEGAKKISDCHVVPMGDKLMGKLVNLSKECLQESSSTNQRGYLEVKINLSTKSWAVNGKDGMPGSASGFLTIDEKALSEIGKLSSLMEPESERWQLKLEEIGGKLKELLLQPESGIYTELLSCIKVALARGTGGSLEDTRVRFILDPKFHNVLLESVMFPDDPKFWMLQAPFSRQLCRHDTSKVPLFERNQRFNCLLIDANLDQNLIKQANSSTEKAIYAPTLTHSSQECEKLKTLFSKHSQFVDKVELIRREHKDENFTETVKDWLVNKGPWHLVHFSGHSLVDQNTNHGYVLLQDVGKIESVEIAKFAEWLRQTSFIFLSSCKSSAKNFVEQLVLNQVPAVAGFRWDVEDEIAVQYTDVFYNELFSEKSLDRAFFKARRSLYDNLKYSKNRIWAAPMLIDQHNF